MSVDSGNISEILVGDNVLTFSHVDDLGNTAVTTDFTYVYDITPPGALSINFSAPLASDPTFEGTYEASAVENTAESDGVMSEADTLFWNLKTVKLKASGTVEGDVYLLQGSCTNNVDSDISSLTPVSNPSEIVLSTSLDSLNGSVYPSGAQSVFYIKQKNDRGNVSVCSNPLTVYYDTCFGNANAGGSCTNAQTTASARFNVETYRNLKSDSGIVIAENSDNVRPIINHSLRSHSISVNKIPSDIKDAWPCT